MTCPICQPPESCKAYQQIWNNLRRPDGHRWRVIHDRLNGLTPVTESPFAEPPDPGQYPSLLTQLGNAAHAAASWAASGFKVVSQKEKDRRLVICKTCEKYDAAQSRCRQCGCKTAIKDWLASEKCPIDKW